MLKTITEVIILIMHVQFSVGTIFPKENYRDKSFQGTQNSPCHLIIITNSIIAHSACNKTDGMYYC